MIIFALGTFSLILVVVLGIILAVILFRMFNMKKDTGSAGAQPRDLADMTIKDARVGDVVAISGFGDEYDDVNFVIEKRNRYESGGVEWFELLGVYKGRQVWIEWEEDDALEITATTPERKLRLSQLNLTEEDLARMDEEESTDNFVEWEGQKYYYNESCEAFYYKDCGGPGEGYYLWDFEGEDGESFLAAEKWEGEAFDLFTGKMIKPYNVKVYKTSRP